MGKLTDPEILACYRNALANWSYYGYIVFEPQAVEGLRKHFRGYKEKEFKELLFNYAIRDGGDIDQVVESREPWREQWSHHYDLRPIVDSVKVYVETRLRYSKPDDPDDPIIYVVNIHPA